MQLVEWEIKPEGRKSSCRVESRREGLGAYIDAPPGPSRTRAHHTLRHATQKHQAYKYTKHMGTQNTHSKNYASKQPQPAATAAPQPKTFISPHVTWTRLARLSACSAVRSFAGLLPGLFGRSLVCRLARRPVPWFAYSHVRPLGC